MQDTTEETNGEETTEYVSSPIVWEIPGLIEPSRLGVKDADE